MQSNCPTCENPANPANFGGCCDTCEAERKARTERNRQALRRYGLQNTEVGRAIGA